MKKLQYIYIKKYRNLKNIGVNLDNQYWHEVNDDEKTVVRTKREDFIGELWGRGISNLTAIIGENGVGKSNILRFIIEHVIEGLPNSAPPGYVIWTDGVNSFCYSGIGDIRLAVGPKEQILHSKRPDVGLVFYSPYFQLTDDILCKRWSGLNNCAEACQLLNSVEEEINISPTGGLPTSLLIETYSVQKQMKIALFVSLFYKDLREVLNMALPLYIVLRPNTSVLKQRHYSRQEADGPITSGDFNQFGNTNHLIRNIIFNSVIAYLTDHQQEINLRHQYGIEEKSTGISHLFDKYTDIYNLIKKKCPDIADNFLNRLFKVCYSIENNFVYDNHADVYYINLKERAERLRTFVKETYGPRDFLVARFYDLNMSYSLGFISPLSSAEYLVLNLFSQLYYRQHIKAKKFDNVQPVHMVVLDEAEIGLHPEWQKKFIYFLTKMMANRQFAPEPLQLIITTHSPIILSDIPLANSVYLKKEGVDTIVCTREQKQTFASNIFDLYRNSFFLSNGMIGDLASEKLNEIIRTLDDGKSLDANQLKIVENIGDMRIRHYIMKRINKEYRKRALFEELEALEKEDNAEK